MPTSVSLIHPHLFPTSFNSILEQIADLHAMDDAQADNLGTNRAIWSTCTAGRSTGNFKIDEDMKLASAYVFVTTNAAIGTDQDGETYWKKIRDSFIKRGGFATQTLLLLKNRFNKVLQAKVNKYIGYLHSALCEFHSGWSMIEYTTKAKTEFQVKQGNLFKHDIVYDILKRSLPKFEISIATIHPRVAWALALLDNDNERALERDAIRVANITALLNSVDSSDSNVLLNKDIEEAEPFLTDTDAPRAANSGIRRAVLDLAIAVTPRPSIGKKKAKVIAQQAASANKKMKAQLPSNQVSLERLASAAQTKNEVGKRTALAVEAACLLDAAAATSTKNHHDNKDADDDNDDAEDHDYDEGAHDETYFNARKWLEKNSPPVIDLTMLRGSDFSDDEKENDVPISLTIKVKVEAMEEEETQWTALDA